MDVPALTVYDRFPDLMAELNSRAAELGMDDQAIDLAEEFMGRLYRLCLGDADLAAEALSRVGKRFNGSRVQ